MEGAYARNKGLGFGGGAFSSAGNKRSAAKGTIQKHTLLGKSTCCLERKIGVFNSL